MSGVDRPARAGVTAVVVTYGSRAIVDDCLSALRAAFTTVPVRVVVVDSGSTDDTVAHVRAAHPDVAVHELGANRGYAAAINVGAADAAPQEALLVLNPDVRLAAGAGDLLLDALDRPGVGIAAPLLLDVDGGVHHSLRRRPTLARALGQALLGRRASRLGPRFSEEVTEAEAYRRGTRPDWVTGAVLLVSPECREAVGAWDESYFLYSEETDYALRAGARGHAVELVPEATAVHVGGESGTSPRLWSILVRNRVAHYRRTHSAPAAAAYWATVTGGEAARAALGSSRSRAATREVLRPQSSYAEVRDARDASPAWVCFAAQDWWYHNHGHSDFQLMRRLARTRTVLLVNSIGMRVPTPGTSTQFSRRLLRKARSISRGLRRPLPDVPRFHVLSPVTLPFYGSPLGRRLNTLIVRAQVRAAARSLGIRDAVTMVTIPTAWPVVEAMPTRTIVFNRSDKHSAFGEVDQTYIAELEDELLRNSDAVVYVSHALMEEDRPAVGDRAHFLDHGVDLQHFRRRTELPDDLASIPGPVIGFFGGIDDYVVDIPLLAEVGRAFPECSLVIVGASTTQLPELEALPNVHLLGYRPYESIPAYGSGFDVALMPWLQNEWIEACNPIKAKEYLALGLPVVTTPYAEVKQYAHLMEVAPDHESFLAAIRRVLDGDRSASPEECRAAVLDASWDSRTQRLVAIAERGR